MQKINIPFFVGVEVLNIFSLTIFSKKNQYFSKYLRKMIFRMAWLFLRERSVGQSK